MKPLIVMQSLLIVIIILVCFNCKTEAKEDYIEHTENDSIEEVNYVVLKEKPSNLKTPEGMI